MFRSRLSALLTVGVVGCSVLLGEDAEQCTKDADCVELGFTGATCNPTGVCIAGGSAGSSGAGGSTSGTGGTGGADVGVGGATGGAGEGGSPVGVSGDGGVAGLGGSSGGAGGAGGSAPVGPSGVRPIGDSLTQTAGGQADGKYVDTCPEDQVLIGINGWTQPDASPSWLMRGQAVCGKLVLNALADGYSITIDAGSVLDERGLGLVDDVQDPALCPANEVVVGFDGRAGAFMDQVRVYCAPLTVSGGPGSYTLEIGNPVPRESTGATAGGGAFALLDCPPGQIARGAYLQAGAYFDGFGVVCGTPTLVYPEGAACSADEDCDTANCTVSDVCGAATCVAPMDCTCGLYDTRSYLFCSAGAIWGDAVIACTDEGMELVRVDDGAENGWLRSTATLRALGSLWIGATDIALEGDWLWTDGDQFWQGPWDTGVVVGGLYNAWAGAQPDNAGPGEHCAEMYPNSRWNDNGCGNSRDFICEPP